jgi:hypothetical protein
LRRRRYLTYRSFPFSIVRELATASTLTYKLMKR